MPSRLIDFDALWCSDRLKQCREAFRHEYTWLYGLADAWGSFELSIDSIRSRVSVLRPKLNPAKLSAIFQEFNRAGLLFTWISGGKEYGTLDKFKP